MSPKEAARIAAHARRLLTARILTGKDYVVLDTMLWRLRTPGRWDLQAAYTDIARMANCCREIVVGAVHKFEQIGILTKKTQSVTVAWGYNRAQIAKRRAANRYVFHIPSTASARQPTSRVVERLISRAEKTFPKVSVLEAALGRLAAAKGFAMG